MSVIFNKIALIGIGLIASSIARSARSHGLAGIIAGYDCDDAVMARARELNLCDELTDLQSTVANADCVILAVPVGAMGKVAKQIAPFLKEGAILSDTGSVKHNVIKEVMPFLPKDVYFIPAHPLAGTEHSGPDAGFASLFENRWVIVTPLNESDDSKITSLERFWKGMGANVTIMSAEEHDLILAVTSHAPHLIAYTMVGVADDLEKISSKEVIRYSAAGFRDFTRIAASDPTMWRDVFLNNKTATIEILGRFTEELMALQRFIRNGDGDALFDYFTRTRAIRREIIDAGQDTDAPNFGRN